MAEILKIDKTQAKIGTDDGKVVTVPVASFVYPDPQEGDKVDLYKDEKSYIVKKHSSTMEGLVQSDGKGRKSVNKHLFVWVGAFLLGGLGVDRFLRGQIGMGVCKLLFNWLTLGIWELVDWIIALVKAYGSSYGSGENLTFDKNGKYTK